ncbi:MAG: NAD(P)/FAD-dependent oxidoreductase [Candidatus Sungbacteria bacterium]|nr:NAD(P)/FAD-dependent oxidoreductase [Candidatus Sungbacteria bacterium]
MDKHRTKPANIKIWDVIVIGGGPAGMMAAGRAAEKGAGVLLIEKNAKLGKKLLITGGGRCNVTNAEPDTRALLAKFKESREFLFSSFSRWGVQETLDFFNSRGMPTKIEEEKRVFPASERAESVWSVLVEYIKQGNVTVLSNSPAIGFISKENKIEAVKLKNGGSIRGSSFILAAGGKSRPETGSTGDGFLWLKSLGHKVAEPDPVLVPVKIGDPWVKKLQGVSLQNIKLTVLQNNAKQEVKKGKLLFTHFGVSGPTVLNMSKQIGELLKYGETVLSLDLLPAFDHGALNTKLQTLFREESNKKIKNSLKMLIPSAIAPIAMDLSGINPDTFCHSITRRERIRLIETLKNIPMNITGLLGASKAVVTSGGVALTEVDFKTMRSRLFSNLYLIGDILDINRPSGGYSLQLCWTTGFIAGDSAATEIF